MRHKGNREITTRQEIFKAQYNAWKWYQIMH